MHSAYKLLINKQDDNIQPCHSPFPILNLSFVSCPVITIGSWPTYRFLRIQVRWSGGLIFLRVFHSLLWYRIEGFSIASEAEVDVFLELPCYLYNLVNFGNLISGSPDFSKPSFYFWKFSVYVLLKPNLTDLSITLLTCEFSTIVH